MRIEREGSIWIPRQRTARYIILRRYDGKMMKRRRLCAAFGIREDRNFSNHEGRARARLSLSLSSCSLPPSGSGIPLTGSTRTRSYIARRIALAGRRCCRG